MEGKYFYTITTIGLHPNFSEAAEVHNQKLQNYLDYGSPYDNAAIMKLKDDLRPVAKGGLKATVKREVHHMEGGALIDQNGQRYCFWTQLCCEDEVEGEKED